MTKNLSEEARLHGLDPKVVHNRMKSGWDKENLFKPLQRFRLDDMEAAEATGDLCPNCGEINNSKVLDTRLGPNGVKMRRHQCKACGYRFSTSQVSTEWLRQAIHNEGKSSAQVKLDLIREIIER